MVLFMYLMLICVCVNSNVVLGKDPVEAACGTLSAVGPTIKGRNITFKLEPTTFSTKEGTVITWYHYPKKKATQLKNSDKYSVYKNKGAFYLQIQNSTLNDSGVYLAELRRSPDICTIQITLAVKKLEGCGLIYQRTQKVIAGADVDLGYQPGPGSISHPNLYVRHWLFKGSTCTHAQKCTSTNITDMYDEMESEGGYKLTIPNMDESKNGIYTLQCTMGRLTNKRTNSLTIHILVPPNRPELVNRSFFDGCKSCLHGLLQKSLSIWCNVTGGSKPLTVNISIDNNSREATYNHKKGMFMTSMLVTERYHMKEVRCSVTNDAQQTPLVTTTQLYVTKKPNTPSIHTNMLKEGQPVNVTCSSKMGRPAPNITMTISDRRVTFQQSVSGNISSTYTTSAVLAYMEREWNGKQLKCCTSHSVLTNGFNECSYKQLDYKFPPTSVEIQPLQPITAAQPYHLVNVTCIIRNANPSCSAKWNSQGKQVRNKVVNNDSTPDKGYTSTNVAVLNVSKDENGKSIECKANCSEFTAEQNKVITINVPYTSSVEINITSSTIDVTEGTAIVLRCEVDSYPESNISWTASNEKIPLTEYTCGSNSMCMHLNNINLEDSGNYTCRSYNTIFGTKSKSIQIKVQEHNDQLGTNVIDTSGGPFVLSVVGSVVFAVLMFILTALVIKRAVKKASGDAGENDNDLPLPESNENNAVDVNCIPNQRQLPHADDKVVVHPNSQCAKVSIEDNILGNAMMNPIYSEVRKVNDTEGSVYACVIPKPKRNASTSQVEQGNNEHKKELIYADLDLQTTQSSSGVVFRRSESPTEYVTIDFTKRPK